MHEFGHFFSQRNLRFTFMWLSLYLLCQCFNHRFIQEREILQVFDDITVIGICPELVEFVRCRFLRIKPNRTASCFTKLRAISLQHQRNRQAISFCFRAFLFTDQI
ncbi:hypothetical protein D3C81_1466690 [compost metagenome]